MSYIKADEVLPQNIIRLIQQYIVGLKNEKPLSIGKPVESHKQDTAQTILSVRCFSIIREHLERNNYRFTKKNRYSVNSMSYLCAVGNF